MLINAIDVLFFDLACVECFLTARILVKVFLSL